MYIAALVRRSTRGGTTCLFTILETPSSCSARAPSSEVQRRAAQPAEAQRHHPRQAGLLGVQPAARAGRARPCSPMARSGASAISPTPCASVRNRWGRCWSSSRTEGSSSARWSRTRLHAHSVKITGRGPDCIRRAPKLDSFESFSDRDVVQFMDYLDRFIGELDRQTELLHASSENDGAR